MRVSHKSFVVVADGRKMLFFRNDGDDVNLNLIVVHAEEQDNPADRDQKTDAAGRASSTHGASGSAMGEVDLHQQEEDRFAAETANLLKRRALRGDFQKLIVVAPPRTLGELRKHYHKEVVSRLEGELAKDLTGHPVADIEKILIAAS